VMIDRDDEVALVTVRWSGHAHLHFPAVRPMGRSA
jgi:hypothetical protein